MQPWVDSHIDWVKMVTEHFLVVRKQIFDDFIIEWLHGSFPLDEAGILITARAYKIHVAVFFNNSYWSTCANCDLNKCKVFLLYRGSLVFEDTHRMTTKEHQDHRPILRKLARYYDTVEKEKVLESIRCTSELAKKLAMEHKPAKNCIPSDEESENEEPERNIMPSANQDKNENIMQQDTGQDTEPTSSSKEQPSEGEQNIMPTAKDKEEEVDLEKMMEADNSQDSQNASSSLSSFEPTDSVHLSDSDSSSSTSTSYICSNPICGQVFDTAAALKKHERKHTVKPSKDGRIHCDFQHCEHHDGTKRALQRHKRNAHKNPGKRFKCKEQFENGNVCTKSYPTQQQLDQHVRGIHGEGFVTYCGKKYTWPLGRHQHQQDCCRCKQLMTR